LKIRRRSLSVCRLIVIITITLTLVNLAVGGDDQLMPRWFWETPDVGGIHLAIGFAQSYVRNMEASYEEAFADAAKRLYVDRGCRVTGERAQGSGPVGSFSLGEVAEFHTNETGLDNFTQAVIHIDSVRCGKYIVVLVGTGMVDVDNKITPSPTVEKARKCLEENDLQACGSGTCRTSYYQNLSWQEAERAARIDAAYSIASEVHHFRQKMDNQMVDVTVNKTDVGIAGYKTVGRALDKKNKQVWVFVEAIKEPLR